jgi:hypothetical protein
LAKLIYNKDGVKMLRFGEQTYNLRKLYIFLSNPHKVIILDCVPAPEIKEMCGLQIEMYKDHDFFDQ